MTSSITSATSLSPAQARNGTGLLATSKRLLDSMIATERAAIQALKDNAAATELAESLHLRMAGTATAGQRASDIAARATAAAQAATDPTQRAASLADVSLGASWHVLQGDAATHVPIVSWMADVQSASGAALSGSTALRPSLHLSAEWALPDDFSFGVMPGMALDLDPQGRRVANGTLAVTVGKAWTPQWRTFVDMARDRVALVQAGGVSTTLDAGLSFLAGNTTRIDVALTHGLTAAAPPFQAGVGMSSRF